MKQILCLRFKYIWIGSGNKDRYPWEVRWTGILGDKVREKGFRWWKKDCGRTTVFDDELRDNRRGADVLPMLLESHYPLDKVVLMLGTNDCKTIYQASAEVIGKGIEKLVQQIKAADENIEILLVSPILLGEGVGEEGYDPEFNQDSVETSKGLKAVYKQVVERNGCEFLAASDYAKASGADREHLDETGHRQLAEAVYQKIA